MKHLTSLQQATEQLTIFTNNMTNLDFLQNTILNTAKTMENTILTPAQITLADEVTKLQIENMKLETEILKLKTQIADKNIAILKATMLFDEVLEQYEI